MNVFYRFPIVVALLVVSFFFSGSLRVDALGMEGKNCNATEAQCLISEDSCEKEKEKDKSFSGGAFNDAEIRDEIAWGRWALIDEVYYRQVFSPGPNVMGVQLYADEEGNLYRRPVLPGGVLSRVSDVPIWFSTEGMGIAPGRYSKTVHEPPVQGSFAPAMDLYSNMRWGRWARIEGRVLRQFFPPGGRLLGAQWYSDPDGNCYSRPVIPDPKLRLMETPEWFSIEGMGTPPIDMLGI